MPMPMQRMMPRGWGYLYCVLFFVVCVYSIGIGIGVGVVEDSLFLLAVVDFDGWYLYYESCVCFHYV